MQPCISFVRWSAVPRSPLNRARSWRRRWGPTVTWRSPPSAMTGWRISSQRWWTPPKPTGSSGVPRRRNVRHVSSSEADSWLLTNPVLFYVMPIDQVILNNVDQLDILPCLAHVHETCCIVFAIWQMTHWCCMSLPRDTVLNLNNIDRCQSVMNRHCCIVVNWIRTDLWMAMSHIFMIQPRNCVCSL